MLLVKTIGRTPIRALTSLLMVCALWIATLGIPLSQHWCGGNLVASSLYSTAPSCGMPVEQSTTQSEVRTPPCCKSETQLLAATGLDNDGALQSTASAPNPISFALPSHDIWTSKAPLATNYGFDSQGPPPRATRDLIALFQTYLI